MEQRKFKVGDFVVAKRDATHTTTGNVYKVVGYEDRSYPRIEYLDDADTMEGWGEENFDFVARRGEKVLVRDEDYQDWDERIFLTCNNGAKYPFICVHRNNEEEFSSGVKYNTTNWKQIKPIPQVEEMTLEQVCRELGRDIKIVK